MRLTVQFKHTEIFVKRQGSRPIDYQRRLDEWHCAEMFHPFDSSRNADHSSGPYEDS